MIELLIVIGIVAILASAMFAFLNPVVQIKKANDSSRRSTLQQLKNALETYYHDYGQYPLQSQISFAPGKNFAVGTTVYMNKLPNDSNNLILYSAESSTTPQWYVVGWRKELKTNGANDSKDCPLRGSSGICTSNIDKDVICISGGQVDCNSLGSAWPQ